MVLRSLAFALTAMLLTTSKSVAQVTGSVEIRPGPSLLRAPATGRLLATASLAGSSDTTPKRVIRPTYWVEGGLILGIPTSLLTTALVWGLCSDSDSGGGDEPCWDDALLGTVIGFGVGGSLGALVGGLIPKPQPAARESRAASPLPPERPKLVALDIDLNNIHKSAPDSTLAGRITRLGEAVRARLASACGYQVERINPAEEAAAHLTQGYFYDHPDVAVRLAQGVGAEWVVIPRLNRASAWVADLQAHVVRVSDTVIVSNRIVELKGLELTPELATHLTARGAAWMADQLSQVIELARAPTAPRARRCRP